MTRRGFLAAVPVVAATLALARPQQTTTTTRGLFAYIKGNRWPVSCAPTFANVAAYRDSAGMRYLDQVTDRL